MLKQMNEACDYIQREILSAGMAMPEIGLILGSGLGVIGDRIEHSIKIPYSEIPNFPLSTVKGHKGQFVIGKFMGKNVIVMQGRFHYYEGYSMDQIALPVRVMKILGVDHLILTNAAGGVNPSFEGGSLMLITDHINIMGMNPLIGKNVEELGTRFPDASEVYDKSFNQRVKEEAEKLDIDLKEGIYFYFTGPAYETPAEVQLAKILGADAVGMSTAPEAIVAAHMEMRVTGISCITNMAAGIQKTKLVHSEVVETTKRVQEVFIDLIKKVVEIA